MVSPTQQYRKGGKRGDIPKEGEEMLDRKKNNRCSLHRPTQMYTNKDVETQRTAGA
jgi:hypothetical protein